MHKSVCSSSSSDWISPTTSKRKQRWASRRSEGFSAEKIRHSFLAATCGGKWVCPNCEVDNAGRKSFTSDVLRYAHLFKEGKRDVTSHSIALSAFFICDHRNCRGARADVRTGHKSCQR